MILYVLCIIALVLQLQAVLYNGWTEITDKNNKENTSRFGLWQMCVKAEGQDETCIKLSDEMANLPKKELNVVRSCTIISVFLLASALLCAYVCPQHKLVQQVCLIMSALLGVVALVVWNDKFVDKNTKEWKENLGICAYFTMLSVLAALAGAYFSHEQV